MSKTDLDLKIISGEFLYDDLPPGKEYLNKYFSGDIQTRFLVYYLSFQGLTNTHPLSYFCQCFVEHTGFVCDKKWTYKLLKKVICLEKAANKAQKNMDLETLTEIKNGNYKIHVAS